MESSLWFLARRIDSIHQRHDQRHTNGQRDIFIECHCQGFRKLATDSNVRPCTNHCSTRSPATYHLYSCERHGGQHLLGDLASHRRNYALPMESSLWFLARRIDSIHQRHDQRHTNGQRDIFIECHCQGFRKLATDSTSALALTIAPPAPLQLTTSTLASGTVGSTYSATLQATGGTTPYLWSLPSGSLPGGITLSTSGTISGIPTASGTVSFNLTVTDSEVPPQAVTSGALTLTIAPSVSSSLATAYAAYVAANYTSNANYTVSNTYYLSSTGNDSNPGTAVSPWATLAHADSATPACSLILFAPGSGGSYSATSGRLAHTTSSGTSSCHKVYLSQTYAGAVLAAPNNTETEDNTIWSDGSYVDFVGFDLSSSNCDAIYSTGTYTNFIYNSVHDVGNNATVVSSGNCASKGAAPALPWGRSVSDRSNRGQGA